MQKILVTGAFGNVGRSTVAACLAEGDRVTVLEADTRRTRRLARVLGQAWGKPGPGPRSSSGDVRDPELAQAGRGGAGRGPPPRRPHTAAADRRPELARSVNVGGTANMLAAVRGHREAGRPPAPRFVFASSVAAYGDRVADIGSARATPWSRAPATSTAGPRSRPRP